MTCRCRRRGCRQPSRASCRSRGCAIGRRSRVCWKSSLAEQEQCRSSHRGTSAHVPHGRPLKVRCHCRPACCVAHGSTCAWMMFGRLCATWATTSDGLVPCVQVTAGHQSAFRFVVPSVNVKREGGSESLMLFGCSGIDAPTIWSSVSDAYDLCIRTRYVIRGLNTRRHAIVNSCQPAREQRP